jgi:hypothetical protein
LILNLDLFDACSEISMDKTSCIEYIFDLGNAVFSEQRGPLSLVSTTEELLDRKVAVPV